MKGWASPAFAELEGVGGYDAAFVHLEFGARSRRPYLLGLGWS
jgi:hypothetical protein